MSKKKNRRHLKIHYQIRMKTPVTKNNNASLRSIMTSDSTKGSDVFVGIVEAVKYPETDSIRKFIEDTDIYDDRYMVLIQPIHSRIGNFLWCNFLNNHDVDLPIEGEAVLCANIGDTNVIIDRLSPYAFGLNYNLSTHLLANKVFGNVNITSNLDDLPDDLKNRFRREEIIKNKPIRLNPASSYRLGRNNQYIIMSSGAPSDFEDEEEFKDGVFLRLGLRREGEEHVGSDDDSFTLHAKNVDVRSFLERDIDDIDNLPDSKKSAGYLTQTEEAIIYGKKYVILYSTRDIFLKAKDIYVQADRLAQIQADRINLGANAEKHGVRGEDLVEAMRDMIDLMRSASYKTPSGPSRGTMPQFETQLRLFQTKWLNDTSTPIYSRKTFIE